MAIILTKSLQLNSLLSYLAVLSKKPAMILSVLAFVTSVLCELDSSVQVRQPILHAKPSAGYPAPAREVQFSLPPCALTLFALEPRPLPNHPSGHAVLVALTDASSVKPPSRPSCKTTAASTATTADPSSHSHRIRTLGPTVFPSVGFGGHVDRSICCDLACPTGAQPVSGRTVLACQDVVPYNAGS